MEFITLANKDKIKLIKDILLHPLKVNSDKTGILVETLRTDWKEIYGEGREFAMQYYSVTSSGVARDEDVWHCHPTQEDRFLVAQGDIITAVADSRKDSATFGLLNLFYMQGNKNPYVLLIPKKTLHGFMTVSKDPAVLLNFPTVLYDPKEEGRVPYEAAQIKLSNESLFSWDRVRQEFYSKSSLNGKS